MKESHSKKVMQSFTSRDNLKALAQSPSVYELYDMMHISSCSLVTSKWNNQWAFCPICGAREQFGTFLHKDRSDPKCLS